VCSGPLETHPASAALKRQQQPPALGAPSPSTFRGRPFSNFGSANRTRGAYGLCFISCGRPPSAIRSDVTGARRSAKSEGLRRSLRATVDAGVILPLWLTKSLDPPANRQNLPSRLAQNRCCYLALKCGLRLEQGPPRRISLCAGRMLSEGQGRCCKSSETEPLARRTVEPRPSLADVIGSA